MASMCQTITSAAVGGLMLLGVCVPARGQVPATPASVPSQSSQRGSLHGEVHDEKGAPIEGAIVTALGAEVSFVVTDAHGRFALTALSPGLYMVRAHRDGFSSPTVQRVDVQPRTRVASRITLRRADQVYPILAAGVGTSEQTRDEAQESLAVPQVSGSDHTVDAHTEVAWRIRYVRRSVLKDTGLGVTTEGDTATDAFMGSAGTVGPSASQTQASLTANVFADAPLSGQVNFLTAGSFDDPEQLFSASRSTRGIAYVRIGAPWGAGNWTMRGALTQADLSTWFAEGSYSTRADGNRDGYDVGLSYSTQRYDGGNFLALRDLADGSRNIGTLYAVDTIALSPEVSVTYGGRYDRFDYLDRSGHFSPRAEIAVEPARHIRLGAVYSRSASAPGGEEFLPPGDDGIWMPPQRTFSPFKAARGFEAERTRHIAVTAERDFGASTATVRAYRQDVADQLITVFGATGPSRASASLGHYLVGNAGDVHAVGCTAEFRTVIAERFRGSVAYSIAQASLVPNGDVSYLLFLDPSTPLTESERVHDVSTRIEADVPETATRVLILYRTSTGFARPAAAGTDSEGPAFDYRFDVQVRQSLPFMSFYGAELEMLVAVRNFFKDVATNQSIVDELLVVSPPKQIVGGVTLHF